MAFVKMKNALGDSIKIPAGAVDAYKNLGYGTETEFAEANGGNQIPTDAHAEKIVNPDDFDVDSERTEAPADEAPAEESEQVDSDERFVQEIEKKPISAWNKGEVKRYAAINNINISGTKNANEAKEIIKKYMSDK